MGDASSEDQPPLNGWVVQIEQKDTSRSLTFRQKLSLLFRTIFCGWFKVEVITQVKLATPIILTLVFQNLLLVISLLFVGQINRDRALEIDSAALSESFANITGISVGIGLSTAADTLCSQTYGYKNYKRVGHVFQRGVLILFLLSFFVWCVWLNTESLLLLVQQSPCVARLSHHYVQIFTLSLPPLFLYWMLQKYFQAQSIVWPFIITGFLTNVACVIFHSIFVLWAQWGINGASLSMVLSYCCFPIFLIIYIKIRKLHAQTWDGWSWESLKGWGQFLKLGIPGIAMTCLEWVSYEIAAFVLGSISEVELAANSIIINLLMILFMIPLGISIASGIRIGNELGAGNPKQAKRATIVSVTATAINVIMQVIILQSTKSLIGIMYTTDSEVINRIPALVNIISILIPCDQLQLSLRGVILGCGHQTFGAIVNFIAFYIIGLPIGIGLALRTSLGSVGMWVGLTCACYLQTFCVLVFVFRLNWEKESKKAAIRSQGEGEGEREGDEVKERISNEEGIKEEDSVDESTTSDNVQLLINGETLGNFEEIELREMENEKEGHELVEEEEEYCSDISGQLLPAETKPNRSKLRSHIKLLLCRCSLFLIASVCVIIAGIVSQFHPPDSIINGNYSECTLADTDDMFSIEPSSTLFIYPTVSPY